MSKYVFLTLFQMFKLSYTAKIKVERLIGVKKVQTQIRLLLKEQSDQGLHFLSS